MIKFYAAADGPQVVIKDQTFYEPVLLVCGPTYGRVLFRYHFFHVEGCTFYGN